jgi:hypothetical protein
MALLSKKEFAQQCNIETKALSVQISRGKVIVENDLIDTNNDKNRAFLEKYMGRDREIDKLPPKEPTKTIKTSSNEPEDGKDDSNIPSFTESERLLKHLDTQKRQKEIEKLEIDISKKRGEVIPSDLVKPIFLQHNQSIVTEFKNAADDFIRTISKKKALSVNETAEIRGKLVEIINQAMNKATTASVKAVDVIISDFSEKRGVGERV